LANFQIYSALPGKGNVDKLYKLLLYLARIKFIADGTFPAFIFINTQRKIETAPQGGCIPPDQQHRFKLTERFSDILVLQRSINLNLRRPINENSNH